jgi:hypothetical protein
LANCSLPPNSCGYVGNAACQGDNTIIKGPAGYEPVTQINESNGTFVSIGGDSSDGNGHCSAVQFCFCPKPMIPTWTTDYTADPSGEFQIFTCVCPSGQHSAGAVGAGGAGAPICLCDGTNQRPNPPGTFVGTCPPPSCPSGQVMINKKCVATCKNPGQILLPSGQCCSPSQATSCGECCPAGQTPDPRTGSCVSGYTLVPNPVRPVVPGVR